jgi:hypothetical protein
MLPATQYIAAEVRSPHGSVQQLSRNSAPAHLDRIASKKGVATVGAVERGLSWCVQSDRKRHLSDACQRFDAIHSIR